MSTALGLPLSAPRLFRHRKMVGENVSRYSTCRAFREGAGSQVVAAPQQGSLGAAQRWAGTLLAGLELAREETLTLDQADGLKRTPRNRYYFDTI